jgi:hypothetical protein
MCILCIQYVYTYYNNLICIVLHLCMYIHISSIKMYVGVYDLSYNADASTRILSNYWTQYSAFYVIFICTYCAVTYLHTVCNTMYLYIHITMICMYLHYHMHMYVYDKHTVLLLSQYIPVLYIQYISYYVCNCKLVNLW